MKIIIAEHLGMCFGVRDAIAQAERLAADGPLTILGELVHNPVVRDRLSRGGVSQGNLDDMPAAPTSRVMITAHGVSDAKRQAWRDAGFAVEDGTCPLVRRAHEQLRRLVERGGFPVVIGKRGHVEVAGLIGDFPNAVVIESASDIAELPNEVSHFGVISQTTQPLERVQELVAAIRAGRPRAQVTFCDTVCQPTKNRQNALRELLAVCDLVVVVGGHHSNNTRELVAACRRADRRSVHVERAEELNVTDLAEARVVGVTAGTSTLPETVNAVVSRLRAISAAPVAATGEPR